MEIFEIVRFWRWLKRHRDGVAATVLLIAFVLWAQVFYLAPKALGIESELRHRTRDALIDANLPFAAVAVEGRAIELSGLAPERSAREAALAVAGAQAGAGAVLDRMEEPERYLLLASIKQGSLCLRGVLPSEQMRQALEALAPCTHDQDAGIGVDHSESAWVWPNAVLHECLRLAEAKIELSEQRLQLEASGVSAELKKQLEDSLQRLVPKSVRVRLTITE
jgi:hypothetical protein